ncbi:Bud site selection protein BUD4 like [Verticillium longisporum]|uniref:Bud site selection protein BUD4 like n=1 Tax=Verticillium longisporum TaxID=100787 RepID=A0A8I3AMT6_VERLO|nr:Bud site selection protein BUD4 like [Verticillium longisporum]
MENEEPVHPLRISKSSSVVSSPNKMMASSLPRPLSELSPSDTRRNSPSWNQNQQPTKKMALNQDSSPFQSSPLETASSPRLTDGLYGRSGSPSPTRRSSIERLQKASRVKNSNILALEQKLEYDPTRLPQIERPLAKVQGNAFGASGMSGLRSESDRSGFTHSRSDSKTSIPIYSPTSSPTKTNAAAQSYFAPMSDADTTNPPRTPSKDQASPIKSSLSTTKFKSSVDQDNGFWSEDNSCDDRELPSGRALHRHATKSVTFDAAPPQINEYETATPDISSIGTNSREGSFESNEDEMEDRLHHRFGDHDAEDSFDASLEDTDKTPVVGPDDWRQSVTRDDDPFESSPMPEARPHQYASNRPAHLRTDSANSAGSDHRPLPPLPGQMTRRDSVQSSPGLSATAERMLGSPRSLPSPPPALASKSEIQNIGNGKMSLEERLKLMMLSDDVKSANEQQRERRLRRGVQRDRLQSPTPDRESVASSMLEADEQDDTIGDLSGLGDYELPQRISRESILRRVNGNQQSPGRDSEYQFSSPPPSSSPERGPDRRLAYDPDVPIPSTEDPGQDDAEMLDAEDSVIIHRDVHSQDRDSEDRDDADGDYDSITDLYHRDDSRLTDRDDDEASQYSDDQRFDSKDPEVQEVKVKEVQVIESDEEVTTPRAASPMDHNKVMSEVVLDHVEQKPVEVQQAAPEPLADKPSEADVHKEKGTTSSGLPEFKSNDSENLFSKGLSTYMLPRPDEVTPQVEDLEPPPKMTDARAFLQRPYTPDQLSKPEYDGSGWGEPDEEEFDEPGTPDSVIHHPVSDEEDLEEIEEEEEEAISPVVPERQATIKAREVPEIPPIPERHRNRISRDFDAEREADTGDDFLERHPSFKKRSLTLDLDLGLSLDQDFERVIEAQKRGYLMRQNTKLVTASDKQTDDYWMTKSAGNSPVKKERPQTWTVEPWNSKPKQRSVRKRHGASGPVPPMPGQESNARLSGNTDDMNPELATEESGERGRLFVKVMGVKDLDLPIPRNERSWFSLTLDNGVHCVTTAWLELARNAPIGQEFELVVPNDLEFQLTLNVKLEKPAALKKVIQSSPTKVTKPKTSTFSRVFASPKKRKEMELRHREEEERQAAQQREAAQARQIKAAPTSYDLLSPLAAEDGSFARSYVCLKEHESRCYGRPYLTEVACFNEWATEEAGFACSVKSKRGNTAVVRKAPYKIGNLELQLLFVPRPKGATDEDMPKSMNSCIRELKAAEERLSRNWEGNLSQQGGDCPYWRRRYFKLVGTKLTAYHESTRQPRATINLSNAKRLIDDRRALVEKETLGKGGRRRRSAFAEEEEGYMFVEEGFRIRFNNGEVIDFYADTAADKEGWMKALSDVVGRGESGSDDDVSRSKLKGKWCDLILKREEAIKKRAESGGRRTHSRTKSTYN